MNLLNTRQVNTENTHNVGDGEASYDADKVGKNETEVVIPLKRLSSFWRTLDIPLINCEIELMLTRSKNCVLADMTAANNPPIGLEFQITYTKLYVLVVNLSEKKDKKLLEQLKSGLKRTVKWNKYKSQMTSQPQNNNLNYLIDPTFTEVNRLFVLSFARTATEDHRDSFSRYYVSNVRIKNFNVLIDGKSVFNLPVKDGEEAYENGMSLNRNNDYTNGNLFCLFQKKLQINCN